MAAKNKRARNAKPRGKPFRRGGPGGPGRKPGVPNRVTTDAREAAAQIVNDPTYRDNLLKRARSGELSPAVEALMWHYAHGKPREAFEDGGGMSPDTIVLIGRDGTRY